MAGHNSLLDAVKQADVRIIEMSRAQARAIDGFEDDGSANCEEVSENLIEAIDDAQGEADEEGKAVYVILKINGGSI